MKILRIVVTFVRSCPKLKKAFRIVLGESYYRKLTTKYIYIKSRRCSNSNSNSNSKIQKIF